MSNTFILTLLGTETRYLDKQVDYGRCETLSAMHDAIIGKEVLSSEAAAFERIDATSEIPSSATIAPITSSSLNETTKLILDGPDGLGAGVYKIIAEATVSILQQIVNGAKNIHIHGHSRGAVESIFVAHEIDRIIDLITSNRDKSPDDILNLITQRSDRYRVLKAFTIDDSDTDCGVRSCYANLHSDTLLKLIHDLKLQQISSPPKLHLFLLDPVPGGTCAIRWEHSKFYYLPKNVDSCEVFYFSDERSGGFKPVILRDDARIKKLTLPGHHGTGSGNFGNQSGELIKNTHLSGVQDLLIVKISKFLNNRKVAIDPSKIQEKLIDNVSTLKDLLEKLPRAPSPVDIHTSLLEIYSTILKDIPTYNELRKYGYGTGPQAYGPLNTVVTLVTGAIEHTRLVRYRAAEDSTWYESVHLGSLFPSISNYVNHEHLELVLEQDIAELNQVINFDDNPTSDYPSTADGECLKKCDYSLRIVSKTVSDVNEQKIDRLTFNKRCDFLGVYVDYILSTLESGAITPATQQVIIATFKKSLQKIKELQIDKTITTNGLQHMLMNKMFSFFEQRLNAITIDIIRSGSPTNTSVSTEPATGKSPDDILYADYESLQHLIIKHKELSEIIHNIHFYKSDFEEDSLQILSHEQYLQLIKKFWERKTAIEQDMKLIISKHPNFISIEQNPLLLDTLSKLSIANNDSPLCLSKRDARIKPSVQDLRKVFEPEAQVTDSSTGSIIIATNLKQTYEFLKLNFLLPNQEPSAVKAAVVIQEEQKGLKPQSAKPATSSQVPNTDVVYGEFTKWYQEFLQRRLRESYVKECILNQQNHALEQRIIADSAQAVQRVLTAKDAQTTAETKTAATVLEAQAAKKAQAVARAAQATAEQQTQVAVAARIAAEQAARVTQTTTEQVARATLVAAELDIRDALVVAELDDRMTLATAQVKIDAAETASANAIAAKAAAEQGARVAHTAAEQAARVSQTTAEQVARAALAAAELDVRDALVAAELDARTAIIAAKQRAQAIAEKLTAAAEAKEAVAKEDYRNTESLHEAIIKDLHKAKILNHKAIKIGTIVGIVVTAIVGTTLIIYFVGPMVAPVILTQIAASKLAIATFAAQHQFAALILTAINTLTEVIVNIYNVMHLSLIIQPILEALTSIITTLGAVASIGSSTPGASVVKSLIISSGAGLAVGAISSEAYRYLALPCEAANFSPNM